EEKGWGEEGRCEEEDCTAVSVGCRTTAAVQQHRCRWLRSRGEFRGTRVHGICKPRRASSSCLRTRLLSDQHQQFGVAFFVLAAAASDWGLNLAAEGDRVRGGEFGDDFVGDRRGFFFGEDAAGVLVFAAAFVVGFDEGDDTAGSAWSEPLE